MIFCGIIYKINLCAYIICILVFSAENFSFVEENKPFPIRNYVLSSTRVDGLDLISSKSKRNIENCHHINLKTTRKIYSICLIIKKDLDNLLHRNFTVLLHNSTGNFFVNKSDLNISLVKGYVEGYRTNSIVIGYIEDNCFYGKFTLGKILFYVEELQNFKDLVSRYKPEGVNALVYEGTGQNLNLKFYTKYTMDGVIIETVKSKYSDVEVHPKGKVCSILAIIDESFLKYVAFGSKTNALRTVIAAIESANSFLRSTDFDGDGVEDNIGIILKTAIVAGYDDFNLKDYIVPYSHEPMDGKLYMSSISRLKILRNFCLGAAFTYQSFEQKAIGLSFTATVKFLDNVILLGGGICDRPDMFGNSHNILAVSYQLKNSYRSPQFLSDLSLFHELGHSFGSPHDNKDCFGHIMSSHTSGLTSSKSISFSICSKRNIWRTLQIKADCFVPVTEPYCGNGIVEGDEVCDCGHPLTCRIKDKCCLSKGTFPGECQLNIKEGYECHPSEGLCCLETCMFRDISQIGLSCRKKHDKCPCQNQIKDCQCGLMGRCHGVQCHSIECQRIGLKECKCSKMETCQTCCLTPTNSCIPSIEATDFVIKNNWHMVDQIGSFEKYYSSNKSDIIQTFCSGEKCVGFRFKQFKNGEFCLFMGKLGYCKDNVCQIPFLNKINIYSRRQLKNNDVPITNNASNLKLLFIYLVLPYLV